MNTHVAVLANSHTNPEGKVITIIVHQGRTEILTRFSLEVGKLYSCSLCSSQILLSPEH